MPPASAMVIKSSMLVGNMLNAQAYSPLFTSFSNSAVPRMPPTKLICLLVRIGDAEDRVEHEFLEATSRRAFQSDRWWRRIADGNVSVCHWPPINKPSSCLRVGLAAPLGLMTKMPSSFCNNCAAVRPLRSLSTRL